MCSSGAIVAIDFDRIFFITLAFEVIASGVLSLSATPMPPLEEVPNEASIDIHIINADPYDSEQ